MRSDLFTHPKVVRIASALNADKLRTVGGLMSVWCLFDVHSSDGFLEGYNFAAVDNELRWPGFSQAMADVGWLDEDAKGLNLPRFDTHNGQSAKRRAQDAERKRNVRKTSASEADKTRTREEKRREEITEPNGSVARKRAAKKCPDDFEIDPELDAWATAERITVNLKAETDKFRDYTFKNAITDWRGAWRNWMRRAEGDTTKRSPSAETPYARQMREKYETVAPAIAAKRPGTLPPPVTFDAEVIEHEQRTVARLVG